MCPLMILCYTAVDYLFYINRGPNEVVLHSLMCGLQKQPEALSLGSRIIMKLSNTCSNIYTRAAACRGLHSATTLCYTTLSFFMQLHIVLKEWHQILLSYCVSPMVTLYVQTLIVVLYVVLLSGFRHKAKLLFDHFCAPTHTHTHRYSFFQTHNKPKHADNIVNKTERQHITFKRHLNLTKVTVHMKRRASQWPSAGCYCLHCWPHTTSFCDYWQRSH